MCGSMSCEADGGGQTLSWDMDPDSSARERSRCAGVGDAECAGKGADISFTLMLVRDDGDCERGND